MQLTSICMVGLCIALAFASDVVDTHDSDFDSVVESSPLVLMEFYAPWCGHCKKLAPEWEKAATALKGTAVLAKLDATVEKDSAEKFAIRGYPSIKVFRDGKLSGDFEGGRTSDAIVKWVKANSGPAVVDLSGSALESAKADNSVLFVLNHAAKGSAEYETFENVAKALRGQFAFGFIPGSGEASIEVFKKFDDAHEKYTGKLTDEAGLKSFAASTGVPIFDEIGPDNYKSYMDRKLPIVWLFVKPSAENAKTYKDIVAKVAKNYKGEFSFVWIDAEKYGGMANRMGLSGNTFPAVAADKDDAHFTLETELTDDSVASFVANFKAGTLEKTVMSEEEPPQGAVTEGLTTVTGKTFDALVKSYDKDVFIEFYAPWCGHCKKLMPAYEKLAKALKDSGVRVAKLDATKNDWDKKQFDVQGFPTLYFVNKETKEVSAFEGDRTFDGMMSFIKKKASSPVEAATVEDDL